MFGLVEASALSDLC